MENHYYAYAPGLTAAVAEICEAKAGGTTAFGFANLSFAPKVSASERFEDFESAKAYVRIQGYDKVLVYQFGRGIQVMGTGPPFP